MSASLEKQLGFAPRADALLARTDGSRRIWIEFEISRADPVANHAKFAAAHLFGHRAETDVFVSMISSHIAPGRSNLAAAAVYLMRAVGLAAFQTSLLPNVPPDRIAALNQTPFDDLLCSRVFDPAPEIERVIAVTQAVSENSGHRIHFAASHFEVMLNLAGWNEAIASESGRNIWGRRTVKFFVYDPRTRAFAPAKYCAFIPVREAVMGSSPDVAMDMAIYASMDESESRFDGHVARQHLISRLGMQEVRLSESRLESSFREWQSSVAKTVTLHPRGPVIIRPIVW